MIGEHVELAAELRGASAAVEIDPGALQQMLVNLIVSARDAMPGGGTVKIATSTCDLPGPAARAVERARPLRRHLRRAPLVLAHTGLILPSEMPFEIGGWWSFVGVGILGPPLVSRRSG